MAKQLLNKLTNKTIIFSNDFKNELRDLNNRNSHDEITKDFLRNVTSLYGIKATRYLSQFL